MASSPSITELPCANHRQQMLHAHYLYEKMRADLKRLRDEVEQIQQVLHSHPAFQNLINAPTANHPSDYATKITHRVQDTNLHATTLIDLAIDTATVDPDPAETRTAAVPSTLPDRDVSPTFTHAASINSPTNNSLIVLRVDDYVPSNKSSVSIITAIGATDPSINNTSISFTVANQVIPNISSSDFLLLAKSFSIFTILLATSPRSRFSGSTVFPAPTIHQLPRPPPEPDPNS